MAVSDATRAELARLGAVETVEGQVALVLADALDNPRAGMATAPDAARLVAIMAQIRDGSKAESDSIDDSRDEAERILRAVG